MQQKDMQDLQNQHILLGVTGGIAAYKTPILVRALRAAGAEVEVVLSANAHHFVTATALQAVSGRPVRQDLWDPQAEASMGHIELARWADVVLVAPATANTLAKLAQGGADDLLSTVCLATTAQMVVAPAMNQQMFQHPATQQNLATLQQRGCHIAGPATGEQACGEVGPGRMEEPETLVTFLQQLPRTTPLAAPTLHAGADHTGAESLSNQVLQGRTVMITAGPTLEAIDPVRYISNHSSGRQGLALAEAAVAAGAHVILVAGPKVPPCQAAVTRIDVPSVLDMQAAVMQPLSRVDIFIGVAAVADYRPVHAESQKMKRSGAEQAKLTIELVENPDIIKGVAQAANRPALVIGFAAETNDTHKNAREKLTRKGLDAVVVNDVSNPNIGFNSEENAATLIHTEGEVTFAQQSKQALSTNLINELASIFAPQLADTNPQSVTQ